MEIKIARTDAEIAREATMRPIVEVAGKLGFSSDDLIEYGKFKAKIKMPSIRRLLACRTAGKLILTSAITPTPAGEGKTTVSIGLAQALNRLGEKVALALREPSLGPCLGMKGGATGGGLSQVLPMEDINLHFNGDIHAVSAAHNLISAALDSHLHFNDYPGIAARKVLWRRVMDMNDRALRDIVIGLGGPFNGVPRQCGFDITASSEVMAVLCLSLDYPELKRKLGDIVLAFTHDDQPIRAKDIHIHGAAAALLREALLPNLVQTIENVPAFVHGGPFANIAQGTNSILATKLALSVADHVVTEAGFGFDLGAEKYFDIVCGYGGFSPSIVVLVATVRALKMHGGMSKQDLQRSSVKALLAGRENLEKHLENVRKFGVPVVVAINRFAYDSRDEIEAVKSICKDNGAPCAVISSWEEGGRGGVGLAEKVLELVAGESVRFTPLYDWNLPVEEKISRIAKEIYGARHVDFTPAAKRNLETINRCGFDKLPICVAKTQNSLSDNPKLLGRPKDFLVTVREIIVSAGAGFLVPVTGDIMRMPGLPKQSAAESIDIDEQGVISGLF